MYNVNVPTSHKECKHYLLQTCTNKIIVKNNELQDADFPWPDSLIRNSFLCS